MSLHPTKHRKAFLRAVQADRIYREAGHAYDRQEGTRVDARLAEAFSAGWVEPISAAALPFTRRFAMPGRTYYRLTDAGAGLIRQSGEQR